MITPNLLTKKDGSRSFPSKDVSIYTIYLLFVTFLILIHRATFLNGATGFHILNSPI